MQQSSTSDRFAYGHASDDDWRAATERCLAQLGHPDGGLGLLYVAENDEWNLPGIVAKLRAETGIDDWVGAVGTGVCATGTEYFAVPGMAIMVLDLPADAFRVFGTVTQDLDEFTARNGAWAESAASHFAIVHADPRNSGTPEIVARLADQIDGFLVGGLSSVQGDVAHFADGTTAGGVSGVLFSEQVPVVTALSQSCSPIGTKHEITACDGNVIAELDGRPALAAFKEDIGELLASDLRRVGGMIFAAIPVRGSDTDDFMVRNLMGVDQERQLLAIGEMVETGDTVQFCRRDAPAAEKDLVRMVGSIRERAGRPPRGAVYYSCVARGPNMFGPGSCEMKMIERELGDVPLVGFFCNGEISHNRLYGYTGVLTLFL